MNSNEHGAMKMRRWLAWALAVAVAIAGCGGGGVGKGGENTPPPVEPVVTLAYVSVIAGTESTGRADGSAALPLASFNLPSGLVADALGTLYVADSANHRVRRVSPGGATTTLAGSGAPGRVDGTGSAATFDTPGGIAIDAAGTLYVADTGNSVVRTVTAAGVVATLSTAPLTLARPQAVAADAAGHVYVADTGNDRIVRLHAGEPASVIATGLSSPAGIAVDAAGVVYVADTLRHVIRRLAADGTMTFFAGTEDAPGQFDNRDDPSSAAQFNRPGGLVVAADGRLYVADTGNNALRIVDAAGLVSSNYTVVLNRPLAVAADATGGIYIADTGSNRLVKLPAAGAAAALAGTSTLGALTVAADGTVFIADVGGFVVRQVAPGGVSTVLAGSGVGGYGYGSGGITAQFNTPSGIAIGPGGVLYVCDTNNGVVQQITTSGAVSLFSKPPQDEIGSPYYYASPVGIAAAPGGAYFVAHRQSVVQVNADGSSFLLAGYSNRVGEGDDFSTYDNGAGVVTPDLKVQFYGLTAIAVDAAGIAYVTDTLANSVRVVTPGGGGSTSAALVTTLAGTPDQTPGAADGTGVAAAFNAPSGIVLLADGSLVVADSGNHALRRIVIDRSGSVPRGIVSTLAGSAQPGKRDGTGAAPSFNNPQGLALDASGNIVVLDGNNSLLRRVTLAGDVTTLPGLARGSTASAALVDGNGRLPSFGTPTGLALDATRHRLFVADAGNNLLRALALDSGTLLTVAGTGLPAFNDGQATAAALSNPTRVAVDSAGNAYVADTANNRIRRVSPDGAVTTLAGNGESGASDGLGAAARFDAPVGIVANAAGNRLHVIDRGNHSLRQLDLETGGGWRVSTLAGSGAPGWRDGQGSAAMFSSPSGLALDGDGSLVVADTENARIRRVSPAGEVSTVAGSGLIGHADGAAPDASFNHPQGVAVDAAGRILVADTDNNTVRRIGTDGQVTRIAGVPPPYAGSVRRNRGNFPLIAPTDLVALADGSVLIVDSGYNQIVKIVP